MLIGELGRGKYSDCFKVTTQNHALAVKVSYYQEATIRAFAKHACRGNSNAAHTAKEQDAISVSMAMAEVAKQMRLMRCTPHIVTVYCEADVRNLPLRLKPFLADRLPHLTANQVKYSHVCVMELFTCNLTRYIQRCSPRDSMLRQLLFQVVYTLACLQAVLPRFRHNDLSSNNVLIKAVRPCVTQYVVGPTAFYTNIPALAAVADFDFTHVSRHPVLSNERVLSGKYGIAADTNDAYDTHLLFKSVARCLRKTGGAAGRCIETLAFLTSLGLDPTRDRLVYSAPHLSPIKLLQHGYFAQLRQAKQPPMTRYTMPSG